MKTEYHFILSSCAVFIYAIAITSHLVRYCTSSSLSSSDEDSL